MRNRVHERVECRVDEIVVRRGLIDSRLAMSSDMACEQRHCTYLDTDGQATGSGRHDFGDLSPGTFHLRLKDRQRRRREAFDVLSQRSTEVREAMSTSLHISEINRIPARDDLLECQHAYTAKCDLDDLGMLYGSFIAKKQLEPRQVSIIDLLRVQRAQSKDFLRSRVLTSTQPHRQAVR